MDLLSPKIICSAKYIKLHQIQWNKIFLDALSKSDARWDGKQDFFYLSLDLGVRGVKIDQN